MRYYQVCAAALTVVWLGGVTLAQGSLGAEEYAKLMKSNGQSFGATNKAIGSAAYADARAGLATVRQNFVTLQGFWTARKRDDAVAILKDGLSKIDALDKMLAAPAVDQMAAQAAAKEFQGATCGACHKLYREGDNQTGFRFRPGIL
jgi:cytochrome c556